MLDDARDFNNIETRAFTNFSFLQGKAPKEIRAILSEILGEHAPSYATVKNWVVQFKSGDFRFSVFHREADENCVLLGYYATGIGNF
jgi:hypothetical protein